MIDAKYKRYTSRKVSEADLYQLFTYALASTANAVAVFPAEKPELLEDKVALKSADGKHHATLHLLGVHIPSLLEEIRRHTVGPYCMDLRNRLLAIAHSVRAKAETVA